MISRRSLLSGLLSLAALGPLGRLMPTSHEVDEVHGNPYAHSGWVNRSEHYDQFIEYAWQDAVREVFLPGIEAQMATLDLPPSSC